MSNHNTMASPEHQLIESLAYCFYIADGCPEGKAIEHWLEAEQLVQGEEQFEAEICLDSNFLDDEAIEQTEIPGLFVETRCF